MAEVSLLSSIYYLFTIATSHHLIGAPDTPLHRVPLQKISKGTTQLTQLMRVVNNKLHVRLLLPGPITSTADSTLFVFKVKANNVNGWYLVSKKDTGKKYGKQSVYSNDIGGTDHLNGFRARLAVTLNALGLMSAPFISVTNITRKELLLDK